jgi:alpha-galactosidase
MERRSLASRGGAPNLERRRAMKSLHVPAALIAASLALPISRPVAHAQSTIMISTDAPPAEPRLQTPFTFAAAPSTPFSYAIPATGDAPLAFAATGLPAGLSLNAETGIITGTTPAAGSYPIAVSVTNASGSTSATYTLLSGATLAPTPPMGWNSYDSFGASVTEADMIEQGEAVREMLQPFGWNYVVIDYRWYEPGEPLDANGRYLPVTSKYPSATGSTGFKSLSDRIHALGLRFGIHIMRGVPRKAYDADLPIAGSSFTTRDAGNPNDPCPWDQHMWGVRGDTEAGQAWYDALLQQYASWGVDFIKIDDMLNNDTRVFHQAEADAIRRAADKTGRTIVLSFSPGPNDPSWLPSSLDNLNRNASMWRVVNDFWDYNALTDLPGVFRAADTWQAVDGLVPGHWPDLDMLPLGYLGPRNEWHASGQTTFTESEQVSIMTLWAMLPSPLMFGGNPARLTSDEWTRALLTNEEVLAVNQDVLGAHGRRTGVSGGEIWTRELSNGRKAVAFFNRGNGDVDLSATFSDLGIDETWLIRDVWRRTDVQASGDELSASVPAGGALMYTLSQPDTGTGGAGGMGGMSGAAGASGASGAGAGSSGAAGAAGMSAGGAGGTGGLGGTGGMSTGGAGAAGTSGGMSGGGSGGTTVAGAGGTAGMQGGTAGAVSSAGTGGAGLTGGASGGGDDGGCGCATPSQRRRPAGFVLVLSLAALAMRRAGRRGHRTASF